jgi:tripartite-type tricarboxylate transporter receptor subunit TctC
MRISRSHRVSVGLAALAVALAACGGADSTPEPAAPAPAPSPQPAAPAPEPEPWEPTGDVDFIIPFGPGGGFDAYSRQVVEAAKAFLPAGVTINVRNVEGAGGAVGAETLRRAAPDGLTIGLVYDVGLAVAQTIDDDADIDLERDFEWIAGITREPYVLFATAASGITSIDQLDGRTLRFGATGAASPMFIIGVIASEVLGFEPQFVTAYSGGGDLLTGARRGDVELGALEVSSIAQFVEAGDLVPLLIMSNEPVEIFPGAATIDQVPGINAPILSMRPIGAPAGTDPAALAYWDEVFQKAMASEGLLAWSRESGRIVTPSDAAGARARVLGAVELMAGFRDAVREQYARVTT